MSSKRCIYCMASKDGSAFNSEHVIPQAFEKFENNITIHCVCEECNTYFGKVLDPKLSRDSFEALDRFRLGIKKSSTFRSLGKRSTLHARVAQEGPLKNAYAFHTAGPDEEALPVTYAPQVGFSRSADGPFEWFLLSDIPSKDEMKAKGYGLDTVARFEGTSFEEAQEALQAAGYAEGTKVADYPPREARMPVKIVAVCDDIHFRAVAKIAFNYFAAVTTPSIALMPQFNAVRRYVREGVEPPSKIATVGPNHWAATRKSDGRDAKGHYLSVERVKDRVVAQVSLLLSFRYIVILSFEHFAIEWSASAAHFFDLETRVVAPADPLPLIF